jgi:fructokinase
MTRTGKQPLLQPSMSVMILSNSMTTSTLPIVCFGEILWDILPHGRFLGGAPLNVASHLHQWGHPVYMLSAVGQDTNGTQALQQLHKAGLHQGGITTHSTLPTSTVTVALDENGNAQYTIHTPVAWDELSLTEELESLLHTGFPLVHGTLALRSAHNRQLLQQLIDRYSPTLLLDVNLRPPFDDLATLQPWIAQAHFLKMNEQELNQLTTTLPSHTTMQERMLWLSQHYACNRVCVTQGKQGAIYLCNRKWLHSSAPTIQVVDTIGAGDAFMASMVDALIQHRDHLPETLVCACAHGARMASQAGAQDLF